MPVIDFHMHLLCYPSPVFAYMDIMPVRDREQYLAFVEHYSHPGNFVKLLEENGVDYGVLLAEYVPLGYGSISNETVGAFCADHPQLLPFCTINPYLHDNPAAYLRRLCAEYDFRGIKLYPTYNHYYPQEARLYPVYAFAEEMGLPILFHTGSSTIRNTRIKYGNPVFWDDIAVDFPGLKIVLAHGGRGPWYKEAMTMVALHENVYIDISGLPVRKLPDYYPELARLAHKFVFGTDWPQVTIKDSIARLRNLDLPRAAQENILGNNAARLLPAAALCAAP